jgi:TPR repeat protein
VNKTTTTPAFWAGALLLVLTLPAFAAWEESGDGLEAFNSITKSQAKALMARADKTGDAKLLDYSGWVLAKGLGVEKDELLAAKYFSRAADKGNDMGWSHLTILAARPGFIDLLQKAATGKDGAAQNVLAEMYAHGWGVKTDYPKAMDFYKQSVDNGYVPAMRNLGMVYMMGWGVPQSYSDAVKWYEKAAAKNDAAAEEALGKACQEGWGVPKNYSKAMKHYQRALELGEVDAQNDMGWLYQHGLGVSKDAGKAKNYYGNAAVKGNSNAANNLGYIYHKGVGTEKDEKEALKWYLQGVNDGNSDSRNSMGRISFDEGLNPRMVIRKNGIIYFDYNKSDLTPKDLETLRVLGEYIAWANDNDVKLDGYCDSRGTEKYNLGLSERRAAAVEEYLLYHGVKKNVVKIKGHGANDPVAPNDNETNMGKNRRVVIKVEGI